jgi:protein phosphatase
MGEMASLSELTRMLVRAVERANQQVRELAEKLGKVTGTTLTAVAVQGQHATLAHLGDSRAYLLRGDMMVKLTEDHSLLARLQMLDHPILSEPDMFIPRNTLYRSLGQEEETIPDTLEFMLDPNDRILICSDGLWDELDAQVLAQTLAGSNNPRDCAEQLVRMANAAGGSDNSTALTIFVHSVATDADR